MSRRLEQPITCCCAAIHAALLLALLNTTQLVQAESLGRLFYTPEQRAQLDLYHARNAQGDAASALTVNGIVQKQGGSRTVWINGVPQNAGKADTSPPTSQLVRIPGKSQAVKIKVGESVPLDQPSTGSRNNSPE